MTCVYQRGQEQPSKCQASNRQGLLVLEDLSGQLFHYTLG